MTADALDIDGDTPPLQKGPSFKYLILRTDPRADPACLIVRRSLEENGQPLDSDEA